MATWVKCKTCGEYKRMRAKQLCHACYFKVNPPAKYTKQKQKIDEIVK